MKYWPLLLLFVCASCFEAPSADRRQKAQQELLQNPLVSRPDGPISDGAGIISASDEANLDKRLRAILDEKRTAVVVVTVSSLGGQNVTAYTRSLARKWQVGAERGGVVLLVAPNERQVRIETSDEVRVRLTDQQCAEIIQQVLTPRFRAGDFSGGIAAGVKAIASHL